MSIGVREEQHQLLIGGQWLSSSSGERFESLCPATGKAWTTFASATAADVDAAVSAARRALQDSAWAGITPAERGRLMRQLASLVRAAADELARIETIDSGRIISDTGAIAGAVAAHLDYFAGWADKVDGRVVTHEKNAMFNYTKREPVGVVAAIIPWNNPLVMLAFKLAPALAMGNTLVIKPSEHASATTLAFARLAEQAGLPAGVINVVTGFAEPAKALVAHPGVDKVTFTGSSATGRLVAHAAADNLTGTMLELGGKSANIIFPEADLDEAIAGSMTMFSGTGQFCVAPSRLLVHDSIHDEFVGRLAQRAESIRIGDPLERATQMGPVATREQLARDVEFCAKGASEGATTATGGERVTIEQFEDGLFFKPTIFVDAKPEMYIAQEEAFGPILTVLPFSDEDEAVDIANGTRYGLAAGLWTTDLRRAHRVADRLAAGTVWVNTWRVLSHASPFGGIKDSGYGRENGPEVLEEMTRSKSIWIEMSGEPADPFSWKA